MAARRRIERGEQVGARILSSGPYFGYGAAGLAGRRPDPGASPQGSRRVGGARRRGFKAKGIQGPQLLALIDQAHKYGLPVTGHLDSGSRHLGQSARRDLHGHRSHRALHGRRRDHAAIAARTRRSRRSTSRGRKSTRSCKLYIQRNVYYRRDGLGVRLLVQPEGHAHLHDVGGRAELPHAAREGRSPDAIRTAPAARAVPAHLRCEAEGGEAVLRRRRRTADHLGTDHPSWGEYLSGFGTHRELNAFVLAGIPPAAAIKMATINAARAMRMGDQLGTIEAEQARGPRASCAAIRCRTSRTRATSSAS